MEEGDELMSSSLINPQSRSVKSTNPTRAPVRSSDDGDAPDDEIASHNSGSASVVSSHGQMKDEFTNQTQMSKRKTRDRPWKKSKEYDAIQTDDVDICGVQPDADADAGADDGISVGGGNENDNDDDDDISYEESAAAGPSTSTSTSKSKYAPVSTAEILGTEDVSSRWAQVQSPSAKEVHDAHERALSLASQRARQKEEKDRGHGHDPYDNIENDYDDVSLTSRRSDTSRRSNHQQVRMEALKLLEIANSTGGKGSYIVRDRDGTPASSTIASLGDKSEVRGGGRFKAVREKSSALRGIGLNGARQRKTYERLSTSGDANANGNGNGNGNRPFVADRSDTFTTHPTRTPIKGALDDVEIQHGCGR